jgi:hypothetical protein
MSQDRFVYWNERKPTKEEIRHVLEDYLSEVAVEIKKDRRGFVVRLAGTYSFPFKRIDDCSRLVDPSQDGGERWLEVYIDPKYLDVITRMADEFTNVVATGLANVFVRYWGARLEHG